MLETAFCDVIFVRKVEKKFKKIVIFYKKIMAKRFTVDNGSENVLIYIHKGTPATVLPYWLEIIAFCWKLGRLSLFVYDRKG